MILLLPEQGGIEGLEQTGARAEARFPRKRLLLILPFERFAIELHAQKRSPTKLHDSCGAHLDVVVHFSTTCSNSIQFVIDDVFIAAA